MSLGGSPSVLEKTGSAELSTSRETQFPMIWGEGEGLGWGSAAAGNPQAGEGTFQMGGPAWQQDTVLPPGDITSSAQGHAVGNRVLHPQRSPPAPSCCSHLGEGSVLPLRQQTSEQGGAVEAHNRGDH